MALTSTERARRFRAHNKGEHALCDPVSCDNAPVAPVSTLPTRGEDLYNELASERDLSPAERVLAGEAGRLVDRLDRLHDHLEDKSWLKFEVADYSSDKTTVVIVKCDRVLAEVREQQGALVRIVGELRAQRPAVKNEAPAKPVKSGGLADLIDLAARR